MNVSAMVFGEDRHGSVDTREVDVRGREERLWVRKGNAARLPPE